MKLYDYFEDAGAVYLVLEYAELGELHHYLKSVLRRPLTEEESTLDMPMMTN